MTYRYVTPRCEHGFAKEMRICPLCHSEGQEVRMDVPERIYRTGFGHCRRCGERVPWEALSRGRRCRKGCRVLRPSGS